MQVPREYVKNGEIVPNISYDATSSLKLGNDFIEFKARFAGTAREIMVPVNRVIAIYARENGQGMAFPVPVPGAPAEEASRKPRRCPACPPRPPNGEGKVVQLVPEKTATSPPRNAAQAAERPAACAQAGEVGFRPGPQPRILCRFSSVGRATAL